MAPHRSPDPRRIGERTVVDEVDAWRATPPVPGARASFQSVVAEPEATGLGGRDDAVVETEEIVEHFQRTA
jgi:hypothetical protein